MDQKSKGLSVMFDMSLETLLAISLGAGILAQWGSLIWELLKEEISDEDEND